MIDLIILVSALTSITYSSANFLNTTDEIQRFFNSTDSSQGMNQTRNARILHNITDPFAPDILTEIYVTVKGIVLCKQTKMPPPSLAEVSLWDDNYIYYTRLNTTYIEVNGSYTISGHAFEINGFLEPSLSFLYQCIKDQVKVFNYFLDVVVPARLSHSTIEVIPIYLED